MMTKDLKIEILDFKVFFKRPQYILFWMKHDSWTAQKLQGTHDSASSYWSYTIQDIGELSGRRWKCRRMFSEPLWKCPLNKMYILTTNAFN